MTLTFDELREANMKRLPLFKNAKGERAHTDDYGRDWLASQWLQALVGEIGEYANIRKKYERGDITLGEFKTLGAKELADVQIYLDLLAFNLGIELGNVTRAKFNEVSKRIGVGIYL